MAKTACARGWDPLELLVRVRAEEVTGRETHGGENHTRAARFPQVKILDDVDFAHQRSASRSRAMVRPSLLRLPTYTNSTSSAKPTT